MKKYREYNTDIYVQEQGGASIRLLQSSVKTQLSTLYSEEGLVRALMNCSYFTSTYVLGRNQGDLFNITHSDDEVYCDLAIKKDGTFKAGQLHSWDFTNDVVCGFSPCAILINEGQDVQLISTAFYPTSALNKKEPLSALAVLSSGRCVMMVCNGRSTNNAGLTPLEFREFARKHYDNISVFAILDGGGSAELVVDGDIQFKPTDGQERPMFNGIAFVEEYKQRPFMPRRARAGVDGNPIFYGSKFQPYQKNPLPNCVAMAAGRSTEIAGVSIIKELPSRNAVNWFTDSKWGKGTEPKPGAVLVWGGTLGHVAVVEVDTGSSLIISQSNYTRKDPATMDANIYQSIEIPYPVVGKITPKIGLKFLGYLYNPHAADIRKARDPKVDQVEVLSGSLRARDAADGNWYRGRFAAPGIYNVLDKVETAGYLWLKLWDGFWIASNDSANWTKIYPGEEIPEPIPEPEPLPDGKDELIEKLKADISELQTKVKDDEIKISVLKADIQALNSEIAVRDGRIEEAASLITGLSKKLTDIREIVKEV